jgi:hypothetical protein
LTFYLIFDQKGKYDDQLKANGLFILLQVWIQILTKHVNSFPGEALPTKRVKFKVYLALIGQLTTAHFFTIVRDFSKIRN